MKKSVRNVSIALDSVPCFAGQLLRGSLNFTLLEDTFFKSIVLCFEGSSRTAKGSDTAKPKVQWYYQVRVPCMTYIEQACATANGPQLNSSDGGKRKLDKGDHVIPFVFPLPHHVPTSFGGKYGFVYHCVKATITVAAMFGSNEFNVEQPVPLIGMEDLNWHPASAMPVSARYIYTKKRLCITRAVAHMVLRMAKSGFVIGAPLDFNLEVSHTHGRHPIKKVTIRLMQSVYYQCGDGAERVTNTTVAQVEKGPVLPGGVLMVEDEKLMLTGLPPSFLRGCENITIHYDLGVLIDDQMCLRTPVILGTMTHARHALPIEWLPTQMQEEHHKQPRVQPSAPPHPPPMQPRHPRIPANFATGWRVPVSHNVPPPGVMLGAMRPPWRHMPPNGFHPNAVPMCHIRMQKHNYNKFAYQRDVNHNVTEHYEDDDKPVLKIEEIED